MASPAQTVAPVTVTVGKVFTVTTAVAVEMAEHPFLDVIVTMYVPASVDKATAETVGFCSVLVNVPPTFVQAYVASTNGFDVFNDFNSTF